MEVVEPVIGGWRDLGVPMLVLAETWRHFDRSKGFGKTDVMEFVDTNGRKRVPEKK